MTRLRPLERHATETRDIVHDGQKYVVAVGMQDEERPVNLFITPEKASSQIGDLLRDASILCNLAYQHGATWAQMSAAITRKDETSPATVIGAALDSVK